MFQSLIIASVQEVGILFFLDGRLNFIESLFDELSILYVEDAISVALDLWIVRHHHASGGAVLTFALGSNAIDIENQVHDGN